MEPERLRDWTETDLLRILAEIEDMPNDAITDHIFGPFRQKSIFVRKELANRERERTEKTQWDKWAADMFQRIQAYDDAMKVARDQLDHQKKVSLVSTIVAVVAALAAVASAVASFLGRQ